jgi:hypothetical protein
MLQVYCVDLEELSRFLIQTNGVFPVVSQYCSGEATTAAHDRG